MVGWLNGQRHGRHFQDHDGENPLLWVAAHADLASHLGTKIAIVMMMRMMMMMMMITPTMLLSQRRGSGPP